MIIITKLLEYLTLSKMEFEYMGNKNASICTYSSLANIKRNSIVWIKNPLEYDINQIDKDYEVIVLTTSDVLRTDDISCYNLIICEYPKQLYFSILNHFFIEKENNGIASSAVVDSTNIGENVNIGCNSYIGKDVTIGDNVVVKNNVSIECKCEIGANSVISSGVVIGTDGFGYYKDADGTHKKVPHLGGVLIGKYVEIGSNTCIDKGTIDNTVIGNHVKIDNLCHIAHNVILKDNAMIIALSMIAGSSTIGNNSWIAPGVMIRNQITIGEHSIVGLGAVVTKDVEPNTVVMGVPARFVKINDGGIV
jgi:UDP-3-O-[3-hydroxymyristoyl] glucosamine N-acyltransferase